MSFREKGQRQREKFLQKIQNNEEKNKTIYRLNELSSNMNEDFKQLY